jgi:hypothetical protein
MNYNFQLIESNGAESSYCTGSVITDYADCAAKYCRLVYECLQEGRGPLLVLPVRMVATIGQEVTEVTPYNVGSPELLAKVRKLMVIQYDIIKSN